MKVRSAPPVHFQSDVQGQPEHRAEHRRRDDLHDHSHVSIHVGSERLLSVAIQEGGGGYDEQLTKTTGSLFWALEILKILPNKFPAIA